MSKKVLVTRSAGSLNRRWRVSVETNKTETVHQFVKVNDVAEFEEKGWKVVSEPNGFNCVRMEKEEQVWEGWVFNNEKKAERFAKSLQN